MHFLRWLQAHTDYEAHVVLVREGDLIDDFLEVSTATYLYTADNIFMLLGPPRANSLGGHAHRVSRAVRRWAGRTDASALGKRELPACDLAYINTMAAGHVLSLVAPATPVITHVHELDFQLDLIEHAEAGDVREIVARTDRYVAASNQVADVLRSRYQVPSERISTCYEFLPSDATTVSPYDLEAARNSLGLSEDQLVVGTVGAVEWRKGADLFLQVARSVLHPETGLPEVRFIWVGAPSEYFWKLAIAHDLKSLELANRVEFVGDRSDVRALIGLMDVFVLTSRSDPFPLGSLEASALGKPVVAFDAGGVTEFLRPDEQLVVPYLDVDAMARRVVGLLASPGERRALGERLAVRVREHHLVEKSAPLLMQQIEEAIRRHS